MDRNKFLELLAKAKATAAAAKEAAEKQQLEIIEQQITDDGVTHVDLEQAGVSEASIQSDEGRDAAVDIIQEIASNVGNQQKQDTSEGAEEDVQESEASSDPGAEPHGGREIGVARDVILNERQAAFNDAVQSEQDVVLIGAAGTGKTTSMRRVTADLVASGRIKPLTNGTKWLRMGSPGAVVLSYTRKAVNNIRHAVADEFKPHTLTIHKLLEYAPVYYEIEDPTNPGRFKKTMRFEPQRTRDNPLPPDLGLVVFEESSMIGVDLYNLLQDALPHKHQEVFIGDIQQLPPVFGLAILGFKMNRLPVIELTEVYRQALLSPIISLAWEILRGEAEKFISHDRESFQAENAKGKKFTKFRWPTIEAHNVDNEHGSLKIQPWQKRLSPDVALFTVIEQFKQWTTSGYYNPDDDIILCPFNKAFGTIEINKGIQQFLGKRRGAIVHEVIAGFEKVYLAVGDRVLHDKEDAFIVNIAKNGSYLGKPYQPPSVHLDRWGHLHEDLTETEKLQHQIETSELSADAIDKLLENAVAGEEERVVAASHVITCRFAYGDEREFSIDSASDVKNLLGGNAITIHKAQGSEWEKVFIVLHDSHRVMNQRELLYTAVTRAKKHLHIICEPDTFEKGVRSQKYPGDTIEQKMEWFKGREASLPKKEESERPAGEFKPGVYKGTETAIAIAAREVPRMPLVRLADLVPDDTRRLFEFQLKKHWLRATEIWGEEIGPVPALDFNLQRHNILGLANYKQHKIKLNPVWCILSKENSAIEHEMIHDTLIHEICHLTAGKYSGAYSHATGWIMAMKLMGVKPERVYTGDTLPPWMEGYREIVRRKLEELAAGQNAEIAESNETEDGDVV